MRCLPRDVHFLPRSLGRRRNIGLNYQAANRHELCSNLQETTMVDFRKDSRMAWRADFADGMRRLEGRVVTVTTSLQDLSVSVTVGFVEQRE